jgi:hypothetical protein
MPIDSVTTGSKERTITVTGDPTSSSNLQAVQAITADALSLASYYLGLTAGPNILLNAAGTYDRQRSAIGALGIPAVNTEGTKASYSAAILGFTPAASATDFAQIAGSGSKTIRVTRISISGIATAAATVDIQLLKRSTANTGGTPTSVTLVPHDSNDAAATGTVTSYGANPTTGTLTGAIRAQKLNLGAAGAAGLLVWDFTARNSKGIVLRGAAQSLCLNWNGGSVPSGAVISADIEFTEE